MVTVDQRTPSVQPPQAKNPREEDDEQNLQQPAVRLKVLKSKAADARRPIAENPQHR